MLVITINGIDRSSNINPKSLSITNALTDQVDTCSFTFETTVITEKPVEGQEVVVKDGVEKIFAGHITNAPESELTKGEFVYQVQCSDYQRQLDKLLVIEKYYSAYSGDIIKDIISTYCPGFTTVNVNQGVLINNISFNYKYPSECFKELSEITGYNWYSDYDKDIHFFDQFTNLAPFNLDDKQTNFADLEIEADITQLRNRVYFRGGTYLSDPYTETHLGGKEVWLLGYHPSNMSVKVNEVTKSVGIENINDASTVDFLMNYQEKHVIPGKITTTSSDVIKFTYQYDVPVLTVQDDVDSINRIKTIEGGDGIYEHIIVNKEVESRDLARQLSQANLEQYSNPLLSGSFSTNVKGLRSGQLIHILQSNRYIDNHFLINRVTTKWLTEGIYSYQVEIASRLKGVEDLMMELFRRGRTIEVREDEVLDKLMVLRDRVSLKDSISIVSGAPETRVGFARVGYSEVV